MEGRVRTLAQRRQETLIGITRMVGGRRTVGKLEARAPFRLDRRGGEE